MQRILKPSFRIKASYEAVFVPGDDSLLVIGSKVSRWGVADRAVKVSSRILSHPSSLDVALDRSLAAVKSTSGRIAIVDPDTLDVVLDFRNSRDGEGSNILFSPCGKCVIDGTWGGKLKVRRVQDSKGVFEKSYDHSMVTFVTASADRSVYAWVVSPKATSDSQPPPPAYIVVDKWPFGTEEPEVLSPRFDRISSLALSPDGTRFLLVAGVPPSRLVVVNRMTHQVDRSLRIEVGGCGSDVAWSQDMTHVACVGRKQSCLYRASDLKESHRVPLDYACSVAFSGSGEFVALGSWEMGLVLSTEHLARYDYTA